MLRRLFFFRILRHEGFNFFLKHHFDRLPNEINCLFELRGNISESVERLFDQITEVFNNVLNVWLYRSKKFSNPLFNLAGCAFLHGLGHIGKTILWGQGRNRADDEDRANTQDQRF